MLMTREEFYEECVNALTAAEFYTLFGVDPLDIWDWNYSFDKVKWNYALEYAYNEACMNI